MISRYYPELNDKEWLHENYIQQRLSTNQIGIKIKCNPNSVRNALLGFNIIPRNSSEAQITDYPITLNTDIITGSLLGDAGLQVYRKQSNICAPYFYKGNKFKDHIEYIAKQFYPQDCQKFIKYSPSFINEREYPHYRFRTYATRLLDTCYKEWYPKINNYKKIVPKTLKLNPEIIHHWFLDDGCTTYIKKTHKWYASIGISSEGFTKEENEFLVKQLNDIADLNAKVSYCHGGSQCMIRLPHSAASKFYNLIGPPIIQSLAYKWKEHLSDHIDPRDTLRYKQVTNLTNYV